MLHRWQLITLLAYNISKLICDLYHLQQLSHDTKHGGNFQEKLKECYILFFVICSELMFQINFVQGRLRSLHFGGVRVLHFYSLCPYLCFLLLPPKLFLFWFSFLFLNSNTSVFDIFLPFFLNSNTFLFNFFSSA